MVRAAFVLGVAVAALALLWSAAGAIPDPYADPAPVQYYTWTVDGEIIAAPVAPL